MDQGVIRSLKAHYRCSLVKKMIHAIDETKALPKISVLDAMRMLTFAWNQKVTKETIVNCFRKSGISEASQQEALEDKDDPFAALNFQLQTLRSTTEGDMPKSVTAQDFAKFDDNLSVQNRSIQSDSQILQQVLSNDVEIPVADEIDVVDLEGDSEPPKRPKIGEVRNALKTLQDFGLYMEGFDASSYQHHCRSIEHSVDNEQSRQQRQRTIADYFDKK